MSKDYVIVHKSLLPDYLEKVIRARNLLENREAASIADAVRKTGISRSTYYKYRDFVFEESASDRERHATLSIILKHEKGALASVIQLLSQKNTNILTISQSLPVAGKANVLITTDISHLKGSVEDFTEDIKKLPPVRAVHLDAIE